MADNSRRYNLDVCSLISYGIGSTGTSYQCSVLEAFSVDIDGTVCNYPAVTVDALGELSVPAYEERVSDYLDYINIESDITKQRLIDESQDSNPYCDDPCGLNPDFLVYRFLDGVRVIDIGTPVGVAQYRAYEVGADPSGATWQESGTFFGLDLTKTYIFEIRDYYEYAEYCLVSRAISLPSLVPSTTYSPPPVTVFLAPLTVGSSGPMNYKTGFIRANVVSTGLPLSGVEKVSVSFTGVANASGDATTCASIFCQTAGSGTFVKIFDMDNTDLSPQTDSVLIQAADVVCYHLQTIVPTNGSCACTCVDLTSVNGLSVTVPTINLGACCVDITCGIAPLNVTVSTVRTSDYSDVTSCNQNGNFLFNGAVAASMIPSGQVMDLDLCARISVTNSGTGSAILYCKPNGSSTFQLLKSHTQANSQPYTGTVNVRNGDCLCYKLTTNVATAGATATSEFAIVDSDATYGINPIIGTPNDDSISQAAAAVPFVVAFCRINDAGFSGGVKNCYGGLVNVRTATNGTLSGSQCVRVAYDATTFISNTIGSGLAYARVTCQTGGVGGFGEIFDIEQGCSDTGFFYIKANDVVCYCAVADVHLDNAVEAQADIYITGAIGYNGISASVCATPECKYHERVYVESP